MGGGSSNSAPSEEPRAPPVRRLVENADACLEPVSPDDFGRSLEHYRSALDFDPAKTLAAALVTPSFRPPWMLSLHRHGSGRYFMRLTQPGEDPNRPIKIERPVVRKTALLFEKLWKVSIARIQPVHSDTFTVDGVAYYFLRGDRSGITVSPRSTSLLAQSTFVVDRLHRMIQDGPLDDQDALDFLDTEMQDAIARSTRDEPCTRTLTK